MDQENILEIKNLHVSFMTDDREAKAVRGVNLHLKASETLAIVGESGSGKSVTAQSIIRLIPQPPGVIKDGEIQYRGKNLIDISEREMNEIRGGKIGTIFQDPMTSLNPTLTVGDQLTESVRRHLKYSKEKAEARALELLTLVGIPDAKTRLKQYPHEFSGGMRQRVMIAIALACNPDVLIADEPTTALDVTIQAQIMELMKDLQDKFHMSILLITHDLGVVANMAQRVVVMYGGKIVETGTVDEIFYNARHPYTWGLLSSIPNMDNKDEELIAIKGTPPSISNLPKGCPFAARCPYAMKKCIEEMPAHDSLSETQSVACWLTDERAPKVEKPDAAKVGAR